MALTISARQLLDTVIRPTLELLREPYTGLRAEVALVVIALQESRLLDRWQIGGGPGRSWWQVEPQTYGAVVQKWAYGRSKLRELGLIDKRGLPIKGAPADILAYSELAACIVARGIMWLDPEPLPAIGDEEECWEMYARRCWRPGKPIKGTWPDNYRLAMHACGHA